MLMDLASSLVWSGMAASKTIPALYVVTLRAAAVLLLCLTGCRSTAPLVADQSPYLHRAEADAGTEVDAAVKEEWRTWALDNLQSGDVLFGMGDARAFFGLLPFSKVSSRMAASRYSHTGLISCEEGEVYVYDMAPEGARRLRFADYVLDDKVVNLAIKRPASEYRHAIPEAVAFCQQVYQDQPQFDRKFCLNDDRLYCTELTVLAYRSAGLDLCQPTRLDELPNYHDFPCLTTLAHLMSPLRPGTRVFIPGNDKQGLWSSPQLQLVYENCYSPDDRQRHVAGVPAALSPPNTAEHASPTPPERIALGSKATDPNHRL